VPDTRDQRLLLSIVLMLFGILVTLVGGGVVGLIIGAVALVVASVKPPSRP
jgi:hypothetical protein